MVKERMIVYVSGGITGIPDFLDKFKKEAKKLEEAGFQVINPALVKLHDNASWDQYMNVCIEELKIANTIYMMEDWRKSAGACVEYGYALARGYKVLMHDDILDLVV